MTKSELLKKLRELHKLQQKCKEVKEKVSGLKDEIKAEMTEQEVKKMQVGDIKVSCTKYVSHRFDTTAFKAEHKDLYESYLKETQASKFTLTKKAKKETRKLIRKVDGNEFEVARENLKMLETCTTREDMIALLYTATKNILHYMAVELTKEHWDYKPEQKCEKVEIGINAELKATDIASVEKAEQGNMRRMLMLFFSVLKSRELCMKQKRKQFQSYLRERGERYERTCK